MCLSTSAESTSDTLPARATGSISSCDNVLPARLSAFGFGLTLCVASTNTSAGMSQCERPQHSHRARGQFQLSAGVCFSFIFILHLPWLECPGSRKPPAQANHARSLIEKIEGSHPSCSTKHCRMEYQSIIDSRVVVHIDLKVGHVHIRSGNTHWIGVEGDAFYHKALRHCCLACADLIVWHVKSSFGLKP